MLPAARTQVKQLCEALLLYYRPQTADLNARWKAGSLMMFVNLPAPTGRRSAYPFVSPA